MGHPPQPQHPQYPSYMPPQQPGPYPQPPSSGGSWIMGLLVLVLIPVLSSLAAGVAMAVYSRSESKKATNEIARKNANRAGNWGLTYAIGTVLLVATHIAGLFIFAGQPILDGLFPWGLILLTWLVWTVVHITVSIVGMVRVRGGKLMPVNGIPFFR